MHKTKSMSEKNHYTVFTSDNNKFSTVFLFTDTFLVAPAICSSASRANASAVDFPLTASDSTDLANSSSFSCLYISTSFAASSFACLNRSAFSALMIRDQLFFQVIHSLVMMKDIKPQTLTSPTDNHLSLLLSSKQLLNTILTSRNLHNYLLVLYKGTLISFFPLRQQSFLHSYTYSFPLKE